MKKIIELNNRIINIIYDDVPKTIKLPIVMLNSYDEDGQDIWDKTKQLTNEDYVLVTISNIDWNREMSPWHMDKLFKGEDDYLGDADKYLLTLTNTIIPKIEEFLNELDIKIKNYTLAGYSLAGLFAIYSIYKTDIFSNIISCSGSLWYPNFIDYIKDNDMKVIPNKIYFSLGNKESKTRNELMSTVEEKTKHIKDYYQSKNIETIYEENEGNHFQDISLRIAKGIRWILS